jgi:protocatechuate 3,4-dioxygenase beta subunit
VTVYVRVGDATRGRGTTCTVGRFFVGIESQKAVGDVVVSQVRDAAGRLLNLRPQVLTGVALDGGEVRIQLEPGLRIQGRVIDLDGKGIPNVRIESRHTRRSDDRLSGYGQHLDSPAAITDAEGRFALRGLDEEPLRITARPRAPWMRPDAQVVVPGADAIEFQLQRGHALAGRVLDPFGAPLAEVTVVVRWRGGSKSTRTAADGAFRLTAIGAGPLVVKVDGGYAGYWPYRPLELQDVEPDRLDLELRLEAGSALSGVVVDPDGKPVRGATVFVSGTTQPPITANLRTDAAGRFVAADLEPGAYGLVALAHGFANSPRLHVDVPAQDVRLQLGRTWAFHGNVVGRPEARVQLWFCYERDGEPQVEGIGFEAAEPFSFHVPTNQAGTLLLTIEETGEYALVENAKPGTGPHRLVPQPGWTIEGRFEGGAPKPGSTQVSGIDPRGIRIRGQVQADGTFRIKGVAPGAYDLEAWADVGQGLRRFVAEGVDAGAKGIILHPAP